jgi:hypothetical protein
MYNEKFSKNSIETTHETNMEMRERKNFTLQQKLKRTPKEHNR